MPLTRLASPLTEGGKPYAVLTQRLKTQRNLNNAFAYDLVPSVSVVAAALKAARRVNDFATAVRIFEGTQIPTYHATIT